MLLSPLFHPLERYHREGRRGLSAVAAKVLPDLDRFAHERTLRRAETSAASSSKARVPSFEPGPRTAETVVLPPKSTSVMAPVQSGC